MTKQTQLIGSHPALTNEFGRSFTSKDGTVTATQCHRALTGKIPECTDLVIIEWLARKLIFHHYDEKRIERLKQKYVELGFPKYAQQTMRLPKTDKTKKGNAGEILLIEYIESCQGKVLVKTYKLRYNPNADQSMKGDDVLMIDMDQTKTKKNECKIFLGESKFRQTPDKTIVEEIVTNLGIDKLPISFTFLIDELGRDPSTEHIADALDEFVLEEIKGKGSVIYTGFLWSNVDAARVVDKHLNSTNPSLIFISAANAEPEKLIAEAYVKADYLINNPKEI